MEHDQAVGDLQVLRTGDANCGQVGGHLTAEESGSMIGVAEVHFEMKPDPVLQDSHIPRA